METAGATQRVSRGVEAKATDEEPQPSPRADSGRRLGVWILTAGVWVATAATVAWGVLVDGAEPFEARELALWLGLLVGLNHLPPVRGRTGKLFDIRFPFLLAVAFLYGPLIGAGVAGLADLQWFRGSRQFRQMLANAWIAAWSVAAAGVVFEVSAGAIDRNPVVLLCAAAAVAADLVVNYALVIWVGLVWFRTPVREGFAHMRFGSVRETLVSHYVVGLMSLPIAALYLVVGPWSLVLGVVLVAVAGLALLRTRDLELAKEQLSERDAVISGINSLVVEERTDERRLIAASLHDDVLQGLHYLTLHAQVIREDLRHGRLLQLEEDVPVLLRASQQTADLARAVVKELRESPVGRGGVGSTLELLVANLRDEFDGVIVSGIEEVSGLPMQQTYLYQVGREALVNAVRHSGASRIEIQLAKIGSEVLLRVSDDGRGFDVSKGSPKGHFGLSLMRERVAAAEGSLLVRSAPGEGTVVEVLLPCHHDEAGDQSG